MTRACAMVTRGLLFRHPSAVRRADAVGPQVGSLHLRLGCHLFTVSPRLPAGPRVSQGPWKRHPCIRSQETQFTAPEAHIPPTLGVVILRTQHRFGNDRYFRGPFLQSRIGRDRCQGRRELPTSCPRARRALAIIDVHHCLHRTIPLRRITCWGWIDVHCHHRRKDAPRALQQFRAQRRVVGYR